MITIFGPYDTVDWLIFIFLQGFEMNAFCSKQFEVSSDGKLLLFVKIWQVVGRKQHHASYGPFSISTIDLLLF